MSASGSPGRISHYEILEKLGEGGMGVVYRARDTRLNRQVAIKLLSSGGWTLQRRQRFLQEARAASALNHPNIIQVYDIGEEQGRDYMVMEYVAGKTLEAHIPAGGMRRREVVKIAAQIASGLSRAHQVGIIHRDLKPSNIMVADDGVVKILDFGLAKMTDAEARQEATRTIALTEEGTVLGTIAYMSPEQAEGKKLDARSDIFSFGLVLYEMLAGRRAFEAASKAATLAAILEHDPKPIENLASELDVLLRRCLRKDPARRWQSMADLRVVLEDLAEVNLSQETKGVAPARTRRLPSVWIALAGVVLGAGAMFLAVGLVRKPPPPNPGLTLERLTEDDGLSTRPALSPDGKLVAFMSDRAGEHNFDIWVMQTTGGQPLRITNHPSNDMDPSFSPDSSKVVFRSDRDGGGIYTVPALGGEATLLAPEGRAPRFSPDGRWVAYIRGESGGNLNKQYLFVVASGGGTPREIVTEAFATANFVWSPDSSALVVMGYHPGLRVDGWWRISLESGAATRVDSAQFPVPFQPLMAWTGNFLYFVRNADLWRVAIGAGQKLAPPAERLTVGTSTIFDASAALTPDGKPVWALSAGESNTDVWMIPADTQTGKLTGTPQRLTRTLADERFPSVSRDNSRLGYLRRQRVIVQDLKTGKEFEGPVSRYGPSVDADGSRVAFESAEGLVTIAPPSRAPAKLFSTRSRVNDWTRDGKYALITGVVASTDPAARRMTLLDLGSGKPTTLAEHPQWLLHSPHLSPTDSHIVFYAQNSPVTRQMFVAPFRVTGPIPQTEWIAITDGKTLDREPRWSPDGRLIYFLSERDGFRCIWAIPFDLTTGKPGAAFPVFHAHSPSLTLGFTRDTSAVGLNITASGFIAALAEQRANIWFAKMP